MAPVRRILSTIPPDAPPASASTSTILTPPSSLLATVLAALAPASALRIRTNIPSSRQRATTRKRPLLAELGGIDGREGAGRVGDVALALAGWGGVRVGVEVGEGGGVEGEEGGLEGC